MRFLTFGALRSDRSARHEVSTFGARPRSAGLSVPPSAGFRGSTSVTDAGTETPCSNRTTSMVSFVPESSSTATAGHQPSCHTQSGVLRAIACETFMVFRRAENTNRQEFRYVWCSLLVKAKQAVRSTRERSSRGTPLRREEVTQVRRRPHPATPRVNGDFVSSQAEAFRASTKHSAGSSVTHPTAT